MSPRGEAPTDATKSVFQNDENGLPKDRRLRADGFIIRAQATIHTDGFTVRDAFSDVVMPWEQILARCARQPRSNFTDKYHP
jgi:hypothetical protein